jgi:chromosome segregation ATPase
MSPANSRRALPRCSNDARVLQDPERMRRKAETEARLQEIKAAQEELDKREREAQQQLEVGRLALREAELAERQAVEQLDEAESARRRVEERREECLRRTLQIQADREAAEERFQKQKDALMSAQHDEKMVEKAEMQARHDEQKVKARIAARQQSIDEVQERTHALDDEAGALQVCQQSPIEAKSALYLPKELHVARERAVGPCIPCERALFCPERDLSEGDWQTREP